MAAQGNLEWQERFPKHAIFREISQTVVEEKSSLTGDSHCRTIKNILIENDGEIFVWNSHRKVLLTANLKNLHFQNERANKFQTFVFTDGPLHDVDSLLFSYSSKYLALVGQRGLSVVEIPTRWGKFSAYDGGNDEVLCKKISIDSRFFVTSGKMILDAKWHPGSQADVHLMVLTSDNNLRLYNVLKPASPEEIIPLGEASSQTAEYSRKSMSLGSISSFAEALGERVISFDFAPPVADVYATTRSRSSETDQEVAYPVFVLKENGDILYFNHRILQRRYWPTQLSGPLTMYPAADDNYGLDACSLLCLHCQPPVLVMAAGSRKIYHCIALENEKSHDSEQDLCSWNGFSGTDKRDSIQPDFSLYVHECVELQLSLLPETLESQSEISSFGDDLDGNENQFLLKLQKDPSSPYQYHCSHSTGVHSISLPWVSNLQGFCVQDQGDFDPDEPAIVHHMICTSPTAVSPPSPPLGVCIVKSRVLGSSILCLSSDLKCIVKPLSLLNRAPSPPTVEQDEETVYQNSAGSSPIRHLNVGLFKTEIQKMLTRTESTPLLRATEASKKLPAQECFRLLAQAQEMLRKEYIQKQYRAREEINKRTSILRNEKEKQKQLLEKLQGRDKKLKEKTEMLGEKLVYTSERHEELLQRLEGLFRYIQNGTPVLSQAESTMKRELEDVERFLKYHRESLQQIKAKNSYSQKSPRKSKSPKSPAVNASQERNIRHLLKSENEMITDLVNQVKDLQLQVGL
ncbi:nucleoporin 88-like isoform X3 [Acropora millepora]|uniref:nucleoporin 88-like isoform X3 n=1 Tax=Acropora millepora TaxID=45264 RepID=UPI0010FCA85F|nr:nucleoporin 88-like isoform X3 [Acropora millepora]